MARLSPIPLAISRIDFDGIDIYTARGPDGRVYSVGVVKVPYDKAQDNIRKMGDRAAFYGPAIDLILTVYGNAESVTIEFPQLENHRAAIGGLFIDSKTGIVVYGISHGSGNGMPIESRKLYYGGREESLTDRIHWRNKVEPLKLEKNDAVELAILKTLLPTFAKNPQ